MTRFWRIAYWGVLGLPSLAFLIVAGIEETGVCGISPYDDFTCPGFFVYLLPPAFIGLITFIPFLAIGCIWLVMTLIAKISTSR